MKRSDDTILNALSNTSGSIFHATQNDDGLPDPIDPVVVVISDSATSEDESERWANAFLVQGADLLGDAITIAKETRSPRAVEVANKLLKDLFDASIKIKEIKQKEAEKLEKQKTTDKDDSISMSPAQLLKFIKSQEEPK